MNSFTGLNLDLSCPHHRIQNAKLAGHHVVDRQDDVV